VRKISQLDGSYFSYLDALNLVNALSEKFEVAIRKH
jgi:hypothetical protein